MEESIQATSPKGDVALYDKNFASLQQELAKLASDRKKAKTPDGLKKSREIGDGKTATYVDRAAYQEALDREFPGWSILEQVSWETMATMTVTDEETKKQSTQTIPIAFHSRILLQVIEKTGTVRRVPGIGTSTVSQKEMMRSNSFLLKQKHNIALTESIKVACGWLGLFFDLRGDQDAIEDMYTQPSEEQLTEFLELIKGATEEQKQKLMLRWQGFTQKTAEQFIINIKKAKEERKAREAQVKEPTKGE